MDENLEAIKKFIIEERSDYAHELNPYTGLQDELMLFGDEASDFLVKFCHRFEIDSSQFEFDRYFKPEPSCYDFFQSKKNYERFLVSDLMKAIATGYLK